MTNSVIIIEDDHRLFLESEWIGCGKTFPTRDVPEYISKALSEKLAIPAEDGVEMLLDDTATVNDVVNFDVPQQSSDLLLFEEYLCGLDEKEKKLSGPNWIRTDNRKINGLTILCGHTSARDPGGYGIAVVEQANCLRCNSGIIRHIIIY
ncbi:hypothetical protein BDQ17DRAFT_1334911 [Cyathus striatus]|nr:hypothetical protein BDQ17DRAFT_1334911 [Cyathus striatus]